MRTFDCICGNTLFFENSQCLSCGQEVGWCPACGSISALYREDEDGYRCANSDCGATLAKCRNYAVENVCNRCVRLNDASPDASALCECCGYNDTIPDLSIAGNREKWGRLEAAKRRLFYTLDLLGLPHGSAASGFDPPLAFDFKADSIPRNEFWRAMGKEERVYTSYVSGKLTINIREADPAERESIRVELDEAHRTLLGHFRHEIGHYYWDLLVKAKQETDSISVFGDHENPSYAEALDRHYREGAPSGWEQNFISAYATMHPWEDFAETFAAYLELTGVLHTANNVGLDPVPDVRTADFPEMVDAKRRLSVAMNEMNRAMGLTDFYPKVLVTPVVEKMRFVHELVRSNSVVSGQVA